MIDPQTTWAILADPMTYVVGVLAASNAFAAWRWWKALRGWEAADEAGYVQFQRADKLAGQAAIWENSCDWWRAKAIDAEGSRDAFRSFAIVLQERIDSEAAKRSSITSRGNLTKAAKRKAAIAATTSKLQAELQAAQPAERLAA